MEGATKNVFTVQVEDGKPGKDGRPAVGPVFRNVLAKDGFPPLEPDMNTSWDVFRIAAGKYADNRMLGWRPFKDGMVYPFTTDRIMKLLYLLQPPRLILAYYFRDGNLPIFIF